VYGSLGWPSRRAIWETKPLAQSSTCPPPPRLASSIVASLLLASNSAHTPWWIGLPILIVVLVARVGFWRGRGRRGFRRGGEGTRWTSDERKDESR
jgi:hypothetical protein